MNQTTEGPIAPRSLHVLRTNNVPKRIPIKKIARNGLLKNFRGHIVYAANYHGYAMYKITSECPCCKGTYGLLAIYEGNLIFLCLGLSCLIKIVN